jgi:hypothetical protein
VGEIVGLWNGRGVAPTLWRAVQRAAWAALAKAEES